MRTYSSFAEVKAALSAGTTSVEDLVKHYLDRINSHQELNAFLEVFQDEALEQARVLDQKRQNGTAGKLAGMVIGLKDNLCVKGHKVSGSSKILEGFESLYTATAVQRLQDEDAIIIGRLNCDEFAMGSSNENSAFGPVRNHIDTNRVPGGSSGGSAVAVGAGLCLAALGSDTGGSIRQPASFCGVVGMKPTYGRISRYGLLAYASSFDQIGPFTNTVEDAALLVEVMAGMDEYDSTLSRRSVPEFSKEINAGRKVKVAYQKDVLEREGLNPEVLAYTMEVIEQLKQEGHTVEPVEFPYMDYLVPSYYVLTTAEASSNLSRYDGINYGYRSENSEDIPSTYIRSRTEGFGPEVQRRIMLGTFVLSAGYYDAYYAKGQKSRRIIRNKTLEILENYDFILSPTTPHPAFPIGEKAQDPIALYLEDIFTVQANLAGVPAISLPLGKHSNGMPFGMQLMAAPFAESDLFSFSAQLMEQFGVPTPA